MEMIIVSGHLIVDAAERDGYVTECVAVVEAAREAPGCLDFSITADTIDAERVNVYERWESGEAVEEFRGSGPDPGQQAQVRNADVKRYEISSTGDP